MRLFVAINLPEQTRSEVWDAAAALRGEAFPIRWIGPEAVHLTLKFLGDVDAARERAIVEAVEGGVAGMGSFTLPIQGFGAFPSGARPRVVWVGCDAVPQLELMQDRLERTLRDVGFPLEGRPFRPHLTIGRVRRDARRGALAGLDTALEALVLETAIEVTSVDLMQSELGSDGARYTRRYAAELGA